MSLTVENNGKQVVPLWINGEAQPIVPDRVFEVVNAAEDKVIHYAQSADVADAKAAVEAAAAAFPAWSTSSYIRRREILLKFADIVESRIDEIDTTQTIETSSMPGYGAMGATLTHRALRELASSISRVLTGELPPSEDDQRVFVTKQAIGPVLIISPWNGPILLGGRSVGAALAAGCTVVLKASELSPKSYRLLVSIFEEAGLPKGVLNQIVVDRKNSAAVTEALVAHPAIRKVEFIGSGPVGSKIAQLAGKHLKPIFMELGGKNPVIVLKDANLVNAAKACAFGAFIHHGQICLSTDRIIVVKEIAEEFSQLLKDEVNNNWANIGSAATKNFADRTHALIQSAKDDGAEFLVGDNSYLGAKQAGIKPTIIRGVKPNDELYDTESFGPSASLFVVENEEEAVKLANDTSFGLVAAIWTEDALLGLDLGKKVEAGVVHINSPTVGETPVMALGGVKASGWGSNNGRYGIEGYLQTKTISIRPSRRTSPQ